MGVELNVCRLTIGKVRGIQSLGGSTQRRSCCEHLYGIAACMEGVASNLQGSKEQTGERSSFQNLLLSNHLCILVAQLFPKKGLQGD